MGYNEKLINDAHGGLARLLEVMQALRDPEKGCPWDIEQTFASVARYTIEEAYEVADAIEREDMADLKGELGDLLFSIVNFARLNDLDPELALERTNKKFIFRFTYLEKKAKEIGKSLKSMTLEEMRQNL